MLVDMEGWYEEKGMGANTAKKVATYLMSIAIVCIPVVVWALLFSGGLVIFIFAYLIGILAGAIGLLIYILSRNGRIFRKRLGYWCLGNPKQFKEVDEFMRSFLAGKYIEFRIEDKRGVLDRISASGVLRAFIVRQDAAGTKTRFFGLTDITGDHEGLLAEFRARAIKELGIRPEDLKLT